ncbi:hypothetical protein [Rufibacter latericius]|uniref:hypothetical protein n=1 Tax=Rufibacter latericius TaxID=2487040 RepID=UPI000F629DB1|nr:hypothetical protein [Rufibacter latericius]
MKSLLYLSGTSPFIDLRLDQCVFGWIKVFKGMNIAALGFMAPCESLEYQIGQGEKNLKSTWFTGGLLSMM